MIATTQGGVGNHMIRTKSVEEYDRKRIFKSMEVLLEGEKTLPWIMGIIGGRVGLALNLLTNRLAKYGDSNRRERLKRELEALIA